MSEKRSNDSPKKSEESEPVFKLDRFLHEPIRLQIMAQLSALGKVDMIFLKKTLKLTWGNLSFHSTKLEEKGCISIKKQLIGKKNYSLLQITEEGKIRFEKYKETMRNFLK